MAQVGHLQEIREAATASVEILVINAAGHEHSNASGTADHDLPWLQDLDDIDVWGTWDVQYRDVVVVDPDGYPASTYNLTSNDLAFADHRDELAQLLEEAR